VNHPQIDFLFPALSLTALAMESIGNILADDPQHQATISVLVDRPEISPSSLERAQVFGDRIHVRATGKPSQGPAIVRNALAATTRSPFLVFVHSEVLIPPHFVSRLLERTAELGLGHILASAIRPTSPRFAASRYFSTFVLSPSVVNGRIVAPRTALAMARATWDQSGGFDDSRLRPGGEDREWMIRNHNRPESSFSVHFDTALFVHQLAPREPTGLIRQAWRYGKSSLLIDAARNAARETKKEKNSGDFAAASSDSPSLPPRIGSLMWWALAQRNKCKSVELVLWKNRIIYQLQPRDLLPSLIFGTIFSLTYRVSGVWDQRKLRRVRKVQSSSRSRPGITQVRSGPVD